MSSTSVTLRGGQVARSWAWVVCLLAVLGFARGASASGRLKELLDSRLDPALDYRTLTTEHFFVHYPETLELEAGDLAQAAERARARLTQALGGAPEGRTHLILAHRSDQTTVFTTVFPSRQIFVDVALPHQGIGLNHFGAYHDWLLTHELAHLFHLEQRGGVYGPLGALLGAWVRPAMGQPLWLKEGIAVYLESTLTPPGRGESSTYRMMTRMAVADGLLDSGAFATPDTSASFDAQGWPWTFRPYVMGYYLVREAARASPEALKALVTASGEGLPYRVDPVLAAAGAGSFDALWRRTLDTLRAESEAELRALRQKPLTPLEHLTDTGFLYHGPTLSPDGRWLVVTREQPDEETTLLRFTLDADRVSAPEALAPRSTGSQSSFSRSNRFLAFDQVSRTGRHYLMSDLYILDLKTRELATVSPRIRARDPDIHPDGQHVVFVVNDGGRNRLVMTDTGWREPVDLLGDVGYRRISGPRFSPDGQRIAYTLRNERTGGEDLWVLGPDGPVALVEDGSQNRSPSWTPDGRMLLYSSDRTGVFNIHAYELETGARFQLTHVLGGAFAPVVDPQQRWVYVVSYRGKGDDLARFRWDPSTWERLEPSRPAEASPALASAPVEPAAPEGSRASYSGLGHLAPQYVLPSVVLRPGSAQFGVSLGAEDPLSFHAYELDLRYDTATRLPVGQLFLFSGRGPWAVDATLAHDALPVGPDGAVLRSLGGAATLNLPQSEDGTHLHLRPGVFVQHVWFRGNSLQYGPRLGVRHDTTFQQLGQSFPETGTLVDVGVRQVFGSRGNATLVEGRLAGHWALGPRRQALHLLAEGSWNPWGGGDPNAVFTAGGPLSFPFGQGSNHLLYGYPPNALLAHSLGVASAHYTFELAHFGRAPGAVPAFFGRLSGGLRLQLGALPGLPLEAQPRSIGVELHQELVLGYLFGLTAHLGLYQGGPQGGGTQLLFSLSRNR